MKPYLYVLFIFIFVVSCKKTKPLTTGEYEVNVKAKGVHNGLRAYLKIPGQARNPVATDTAIVINEHFSFNGNIKNPMMRELTINGVTRTLEFVLEPGITNIIVYKDSIQNSKIEGSENNELHNLYKTNYDKKLKAMREINTRFRQARANNDDDLINAINEERLALNEALKTFPFEFIKEHNDNYYALLVLERVSNGRAAGLEQFKIALKSLEDVINKTPENKILGQKLQFYIDQREIKERTAVGKKAPNFSAPNPDGKMIALDDIKGKITIVDFWAAWCGPCRRENPNLVKLYNKYHNKGLEIIGVSLDGRSNQRDPKVAWLKAIKDDKLTWPQVSNLKHFADPVAQQYSIRSIPATFILDEDGVIVAKSLRGASLENKIIELLGS